MAAVDMDRCWLGPRALEAMARCFLYERFDSEAKLDAATPPFSCITALHYYYDRNLLNRSILPSS
jgi:hypothetical protein